MKGEEGAVTAPLAGGGNEGLSKVSVFISDHLGGFKTLTFTIPFFTARPLSTVIYGGSSPTPCDE